MISAKENQIDGNPISEFISDETFVLLKSKGLLNEKSLRDHIIRKKFKFLREENLSATDAIDSLRDEYAYLQYDTIRKIVYNISK